MNAIYSCYAVAMFSNRPRATTLGNRRAEPQLFYDFNWAAAAKTLARAREIDPNNAFVIEMTGHLSRTTGGPEETMALFRRSIELDPMNPTARKYLGRLLYYAGRDDEAEATLRQVLNLNPDFQGAHYELGRVQLARGRRGSAAR